MIRVKTSEVTSVASCYGGTSVTISADEPIVISGSADEIQALGQQIIDKSKASADPLSTGPSLMEVGPR